MRIGFVGKGGSGKTTLSCLFSSFAAFQKIPTLVLDADVNMHVGLGLGFEPHALKRINHVGTHGAEIKEYLRAQNPYIRQGEMIKTTPPGRGSRFITVESLDEFLKKYSLQKDGVHLMLAGTYDANDVGTTCFHKYAGVVEIILNHLLDTPNDVVVIDMTAGIDAFSTGLFVAIEQTYLVVEPTIRSVEVFRQYALHAAREGIVVMAIGNKVFTQKDRQFLEEHVGKSLLTILPFSLHVQAFERGEVDSLSYAALEPEAKLAIETIYSHAKTHVRNWNTLYKKLIELHGKNCIAWANKNFGHNLMEQIDPEFSYERV